MRTRSIGFVLVTSLLCAAASAHAAPAKPPSGKTAPPVISPPAPANVLKAPIDPNLAKQLQYKGPALTVGASFPLLPEGATASRMPELASDGNNVFALLASRPAGGGWLLTVSRSQDGGRNYGRPTVVANVAHFTGRQGQIAVRGAVVTVTYSAEGSLFVAQSVDSGVRFSTPVRVASGLALDAESRAIHELASTNDGEVIAWQEGTMGGASNVKFGRVVSGAITGETRVNRSFPGSRPRLAVDGAFVAVIFVEDQNPLYIVSMSQSRDGGRTWDRLASAEEGNSGMRLDPSQQAHIRLGAAGETVKPLWLAYGIDHVTALGESVFVSIPNMNARPQDRALVAADPSRGLFRGRVGSLAKCAEASNHAPAPLAPRDQPAFTQFSTSPYFFARTTAGIEVVWSQGWSSGAHTRSQLYRAVVDRTAMTGCSRLAEQEDISPLAFEGAGASSVLTLRGAGVALWGVVENGRLRAPLASVPSGYPATSVVTPRTVAFAYLEGGRADYTGTPRSNAVAR